MRRVSWIDNDGTNGCVIDSTGLLAVGFYRIDKLPVSAAVVSFDDAGSWSFRKKAALNSEQA